jgi:transposase-like protein
MGRKQNSEAEVVWRDRLARFDSDSLTISEFCHREGVSSASFYRWRKRLKHRGRQSKPSSQAAGGSEVKAPSSRFLPVNVAGLTEAEIELPNGIKVRVPAANAAVLRTAIRAANEACQEVASC